MRPGCAPPMLLAHSVSAHNSSGQEAFNTMLNHVSRLAETYFPPYLSLYDRPWTVVSSCKPAVPARSRAVAKYWAVLLPSPPALLPHTRALKCCRPRGIIAWDAGLQFLAQVPPQSGTVCPAGSETQVSNGPGSQVVLCPAKWIQACCAFMCLSTSTRQSLLASVVLDLPRVHVVDVGNTTLS